MNNHLVSSIETRRPEVKMSPSAVTNNEDGLYGECARCGAPDARFAARQDMVCQ